MTSYIKRFGGSREKQGNPFYEATVDGYKVVSNESCLPALHFHVAPTFTLIEK